MRPRTLLCIALGLASATSAQADDTDFLKKKFAERVAYANEVCGTNFVGSTSKPTHACDHLFWHIRQQCESGPTRPNPATLKWLQTNLKSVSCSAGPDKISLQDGKLEVTLDGTKADYFTLLDNAFSASKSTHKEGKTLKAFTNLHLTKRLLEVSQGLVPVEKMVNDACGTKITISPDAASWQAGGFLTGYFIDLDVASVTKQYAYKISKMCEDGSKDMIAKAVSQMVFRYVGTEQDQTWQSRDLVEFTIAKGVLTFTIVSASPGPVVLSRIESELPKLLDKTKPARASK